MVEWKEKTSSWMSFHAMRFLRVVVFNHIFGFWCIRRPKLHALLHFLRLIIFDWEFSVRFFNAHRRAAVKKIPDLRMEQCRSLYASEAKDTIKCHYSEESYCMEGGPWASFFLSFNHWWVTFKGSLADSAKLFYLYTAMWAACRPSVKASRQSLINIIDKGLF